MRKTRPAVFDPTYRQKPSIEPELVDLSDAVGISGKPSTPSPKPSAQPIETPSKVGLMPELRETSIEDVRKAVKQFGKEAATHRFTKDEKQRIAELVYSYSHKGIRTSENEITRIAVNVLLEDQKRRDKDSLLDQVLRLLNS